MNVRWRDLGSVGNPALNTTWTQLCQVLNRRIQESSTPDASLWHSLSPATGTGKTQGVAVYAQLLIENRHSEFPGVLFVTNLKREADVFEETVNELCGDPYAYALHSDKTKPEADFLRSVPILVITHSRYLRALRDAGYGNISESNELFGHANSSGLRRLIVVDEAIGLIRHHKVTSDDLSRLKRGLTDEIRSAIATGRTQSESGQPNDACEYIDALHEWLLNLEVNSLTTISVTPPRIIDQSSPTQRPLLPLRELMRTQEYDEILLSKKSTIDRLRLIEEFDRLIVAVESVATANVLQVNKRGKFNVLFTSELLIPANAQGCVLLDATSNVDALGFLNDKIVKHPRVPGARNYANVTLNVSKGHRVGKQYWKDNGAELSGQVLANIDSKLDASDRVLIVCHKQVVHHFRGNEISFSPEVATWGSIAGRNTWRSCNAVVIAGLQYRDSAHDLGSLVCLQGKGERQPEVLSSMKLGAVTADIIQAINRARCREAADAEGGCARTDVYLLLPEDRSANHIRQIIAQEMPGIKIVPWEFDGALRKIQEHTGPSRLLDYATDGMPVGEMTSQRLRKAAGIGKSNWKQIVARHLADGHSELNSSLADIGIRALKRENGRWYFIKE